ncbi:MAG: aminotransferase class I/II-fold pyridoxal phosphate-dependent enzyme [Acetobacter sp.]|uniref:aminotransferase class I/II-fold pyridoxal phosphate-dependent enzyme n=1 Tax=Acetobacter sp. TaxID=440 RepID=UPI0039E7DABC
MINNKPVLRPETLTVGYGYDPNDHMRAAKPPIYLTSTFTYPDAETALRAHDAYAAGNVAAENGGFVYARLDHPNLVMLQDRLAVLDHAAACAVFNSGMSALATVMLTCLRPGDALLHTTPIYGGTHALMNTLLLPVQDIQPFPLPPAATESDLIATATAAMKHGPVGIILAETPANPTCSITDMAGLVRLADTIELRQGRRPLVVVDNTFLGPLLQNPLEHGADLTMTSLTKYAGGHSDVLAGSVSGSFCLVEKLRKTRTLLGTHLDAHGCWMLLRSLETLSVRTERAQKNAEAIARFLATHQAVEAVTWPGLLPQDSPTRRVFEQQCSGAGSTFSFSVKGGREEAFLVLNALKIPRLAVSLGGTETLVCHPATTTHHAVPRERLYETGISEGTVRISVGIEHQDDLIADFKQALSRI